MMKSKKGRTASSSPSIVTARRAMGISRTYIFITVFITIMAIVAWNPAYYMQAAAANGTPSNSIANSTTSNTIATGGILGSLSGIPFLALPLDTIPGIIVAMPVLILFVYDKNSGVLEYMLSLGMATRDIYMRYLKAALLMVLPVMLIFVAGDILYINALYGTGVVMHLLPVQILTVPFALAAVTFMVIAMMAFSSLQKTRAGSNQPMGLLIGYASTIPAYLVSIFLPFESTMYADIILAIALAAVSAVFLSYSGRIIKREKFLP